MHGTPPQPNLPARSAAGRYPLRFWLLVVLSGAGGGLAGGLLIALLHAVQHFAWSYDSGTFLEGVSRTPAGWRVAVLCGAGGLTVAGLWVLRQMPAATGGAITAAIWFRSGKIPTVRTVGNAVLSIGLVGLGCSLGREGALKETGAALASRLAGWAGLTASERRLLVACGAGAGMAAAYNVPLGAGLFALEVLLGTLNMALVLPALTASFVGAAAAWLLLPNQPTYTVPAYTLTWPQVFWAALAGPVLGLASVAYVRAVAWAGRHRPAGWGRVVVPLLVFAGLGLVAVLFPQLLGNGKDVVQLAVTGQLGLGLLLALAALKPLATTGCLASGAPGGLFTPTITVGCLLGGLLGHAWGALWPGATPGSYALIGAGAVLAAATQGPLSAVVLIAELTWRVDALMVPLLTALVGAVAVAQWLDPRSVYSARLRLGKATACTAGEAYGAAPGAVRVVSTAARFAEVAEQLLALAPRGGSLFVVDEDGRFVGEITPAGATGGRLAVPVETAAAADLADPVPVITLDLDRAGVEKVFEQTDRPRLPVVDGASRRLVGVLARPAANGHAGIMAS